MTTAWKQWVRKTPLIRPVFRWREFKLSRAGPAPPQPGPDGLPLPDRWRMMRVVNSPDWRYFLSSGAEIMEFFLDVAHAAGGDWRSGGTLLDYGCGCGRLARQLISRTQAKVIGIEIDSDQVAWCRRNLPGTWVHTALKPPTQLRENSVDGCYGYSVFTHLGAASQDLWWGELHRVLKPGAILILTFHDETQPTLSAVGLTSDDVRHRGLVSTTHQGEGSNLVDTYQSQAQFKAAATRAGFEVLRVVNVEEAPFAQAVGVMRRA